MPYGGAPASSPNDALKLAVGDTSTSATLELLSTGECAYLRSTYGSVANAAPYAAEAIAAKYARQVGRAVGDLRIDAQQRYEHYIDLASALRRGVALRNAVPYAGGISQSDKQGYEDDSDRVVPAFTVGQFDSPGVQVPGVASTSS